MLRMLRNVSACFACPGMLPRVPCFACRDGCPSVLCPSVLRFARHEESAADRSACRATHQQGTALQHVVSACSISKWPEAQLYTR